MEPLETRDEAGAGRTQHAIHVLTRDDELAASLLLPGLGRVDSAESSLQAVIVAPDRDSVYTLSAAVNAKADGTGTLLTPVVASPRGERRIQAGARAICATADDLMLLMGKSLFKPQHLRTIAIVWGDEQLGETLRPKLESVLAEAPRDADRLLLVSALTDAVESFATGFLWRARRVQHSATVSAATATVEYTPCVPEARTQIVRQILDRFDPQRAALLAFSDRGQRDADAIVAALGYSAATSQELSVARDALEGAADLVVLVEIPTDLRVLSGAAAAASRVIALVPPERVVAFVATLGDGATPFPASQALRDAYTARDLLRDEVQGTVRGRPLTPEVLALEPLFAERDPVLVAAALLRLLETERSKSRRSAVVSAPKGEGVAGAARRGTESAPRTDGGAWTRIFLSVGERDGMRRGDLLGAITGEAGITGTQVGKIELRESHALVEVGADVAEAVVAKMNGISLRGRRILAKVDTGSPRQSGDRPPRGREGGRGREGAGGGFGGGSRFAGRERSGGAREYGAKREGGAERTGRQPRAMKESDEWGSRGDRLRHSKRRRPDEA